MGTLVHEIGDCTFHAQGHVIQFLQLSLLVVVHETQGDVQVPGRRCWFCRNGLQGANVSALGHEAGLVLRGQGGEVRGACSGVYVQARRWLPVLCQQVLGLPKQLVTRGLELEQGITIEGEAVGAEAYAGIGSQYLTVGHEEACVDDASVRLFFPGEGGGIVQVDVVHLAWGEVAVQLGCISEGENQVGKLCLASRFCCKGNAAPLQIHADEEDIRVLTGCFQGEHTLATAQVQMYPLGLGQEG